MDKGGFSKENGDVALAWTSLYINTKTIIINVYLMNIREMIKLINDEITLYVHIFVFFLMIRTGFFYMKCKLVGLSVYISFS